MKPTLWSLYKNHLHRSRVPLNNCETHSSPRTFHVNDGPHIMKPLSELHSMKRRTSLLKERSGYSSRLAVVRPTLLIQPLLRKVWPKHRPFVLLTSPSAWNTNATSRRYYNNTVGLNLFTFQFSVSVLEGEKNDVHIQHNTGRGQMLWSLKSPQGMSQTAPAHCCKTHTVTLKPGAP